MAQPRQDPATPTPNTVYTGLNVTNAPPATGQAVDPAPIMDPDLAAIVAAWPSIRPELRRAARAAVEALTPIPDVDHILNDSV